MSSESLLVRHPNAPWLPPDGRADVVLLRANAVLPHPICVVRLLAMHRRRILTALRADGRGFDIPTRTVTDVDETVEDCLNSLMVEALGSTQPAVPLGYVRNVVPQAPEDYPWPSPEAYFAVWHCVLPATYQPSGSWLDPHEAMSELSERHWWPLSSHTSRYLDSAASSTDSQ